MTGPTMAGLVTRAEETLASGDYEGEATEVEGYVRESIVAPSARLLPGAMYSAGGTSSTPSGYGDSLSEDEVDQLVAYLMSLK